MYENSLNKPEISNWRWQPFFDELEIQLASFPLEPYLFPKKFLQKDISLGGNNNRKNGLLKTWGCKTDKIKYARAACLHVDNISVLNFIIVPNSNFDLPFFGADFVTLPAYHLIALDLQPALQKDDLHTRKVWKKLIPLHQKWQAKLPYGGEIPKDAKRFFSPGFLWTKLSLTDRSDQIIGNIIKPAFCEYLKLYIELLSNANLVTKDRSMALKIGQQAYMDYRTEKDPARKMLCQFFGQEWTEDYIRKVLFSN